MFRNILVPLDGTALSESALPYAEQLAKRVDAKLTLVRAVPPRWRATSGCRGDHDDARQDGVAALDSG